MGRGNNKNQATSDGGSMLFGPRRGRMAAKQKGTTSVANKPVKENEKIDYLQQSENLLIRNPYFLIDGFTGLNVITSSAIIAESEGKRGCRGHIALGSDPNGKPVFVALITSGLYTAPGHEGEIIAQGPGFEDVLQLLNTKLKEKADEGGKVYKQENPEQGTQITPEQFDKDYRQHPTKDITEKYDGSRQRS